MKKCVLLLFFMAAAWPIHQAKAADIPSLSWTKRLTVKVINPTDMPLENMPVVVPLAEFQLEEMPFLEMGHFRVYDAATDKMPRYQVDDLDGDGQGADEIVFLTSVQAGETKTYYIDFIKEFKAWPQQHRFTDATAMPGWESELFGYRSYGHFVVDMFGKYKSNSGLRLKTFYNESNKQIYNYHVDSDQGMDILHVGATIGLGGIGLMDGGTLSLPSSGSLDCQVIASGPVRSIVKMKKEWENDIGTFLIERTASIYAHHFETEIADTITVLKLKQETDARFCTGIKKENNMQYEANAAQGIFLLWFNQEMYDIGEMGMGLIMKTPEHVQMAKDESNNLYLIDHKLMEGEQITNSFLAFGAWKRAGYIDNLQQFKQRAQEIIRQQTLLRIEFELN